MGSDNVLVLFIGSALLQSADEPARAGITPIADVNTAPVYRLYSLADKWAALAEDRVSGASVHGELVRVSGQTLDELARTEPDGLSFDWVALDDGQRVLAAMGDPAWLSQNATDITAYGSFLDYIRDSRGRSH